ncbi:unnamed protein product [Lactuca saligna]|uniref:Uncharacterized protein n=1 Tax=Lactuca saligna TaxID=75948 RepID=A0AA36EJ29_LACSI|nr:unnamed protein product [Lactuca saligna]
MLRKLYDEEDIKEEEEIEEDEEKDFGPIYDTDGEGEFVERINLVTGEEIVEHSNPFYATEGEDDQEEIEEEINFVVGNKIVETIVKEIDFFVTNKIVEEKVEESEVVEKVLDHEDVVVVKKDDDTRLITNHLCKNLEKVGKPCYWNMLFINPQVQTMIYYFI